MMIRATPRTFFTTAPFLAAVLAVAVLTAALFPLFTFLYQVPAFSRFLLDLTLDQEVAAVRLLTASLIGEAQALESSGLSGETLGRIERIEREAHFARLRIYSPVGQVVYSSQADEVGGTNRDPYFLEALLQRKVVAVEKGGDRLPAGSRRAPAGLVAAYVPIVRQGRLVGVFEMHYDAASQLARLRNLLSFSSGALFLLAVILLIAVVVGVSTAASFLRERERALAELRALSLSDELTGLYNRRGLRVLAEQQIRIARRAEQRLLVLSAGMDGLQQISDGFGRPERDRALVEAAQVLRGSFRESDIIGRVGGDEFVVLMTAHSEVVPEAFLGRLAGSVESVNSRKEHPYPFSLSTGVAVLDPASAASFDEALVLADRARKTAHSRA